MRDAILHYAIPMYDEGSLCDYRPWWKYIAFPMWYWRKRYRLFAARMALDA